MDAIEKWLNVAHAYNDEHVRLALVCERAPHRDNYIKLTELAERRNAHLRTTPEGFALVPVPEWVPFDEFTSYPAPESSGWFWYIKDDEIFRGTAMQVCLARGVTYWCPADNPPAPPKSEPL